MFNRYPDAREQIGVSLSGWEDNDNEELLAKNNMHEKTSKQMSVDGKF